MDEPLHRLDLPLARPEELARDLVATRSHAPRLAVGERLIRRLDTSGAPGLGAAEFGRRFVQRTLRLEALPLTVSPYAPPQRQISAVRQGAPMWRPVGAVPPAGAAPGDPSWPASVEAGTPRVAAQDVDQLPPDLKALLELHRSRGTI